MVGQRDDHHYEYSIFLFTHTQTYTHSIPSRKGTIFFSINVWTVVRIWISGHAWLLRWCLRPPEMQMIFQSWTNCNAKSSTLTSPEEKAGTIPRFMRKMKHWLSCFRDHICTFQKQAVCMKLWPDWPFPHNASTWCNFSLIRAIYANEMEKQTARLQLTRRQRSAEACCACLCTAAEWGDWDQVIYEGLSTRQFLCCTPRTTK